MERIEELRVRSEKLRVYDGGISICDADVWVRLMSVSGCIARVGRYVVLAERVRSVFMFFFLSWGGVRERRGRKLTLSNFRR